MLKRAAWSHAHTRTSQQGLPSLALAIATAPVRRSLILHSLAPVLATRANPLGWRAAKPADKQSQKPIPTERAKQLAKRRANSTH